MTFFPFTKPKTGLYVTAETLCLAHGNRRLGHHSFGGLVNQPLPAGSIRLSPVEPNILEHEQVISTLHAALGQRKGAQSIALCLPDLCARTTILEMASLPKNFKEQHSLVQWRMQQELNLSKENIRISYQILSLSPGRFDASPPSDQPVRLLATAIKENIIEAYETACLEADLIPISIHLASLTVFNACRPIIDSILKRTTERISFVPGTLFFLYLADWGFALIALQNHTPTFLRVKPLRQVSSRTARPSDPGQEVNEEGQEDTSADGTEEFSYGPEPDTMPTIPTPSTTAITNELLGTLQYFFETHEANAISDEVYPLFLIGSQDPDQVLPDIAEFIEQEFPYEADHGTPRIKAFPLFPGNPNLNLKSLSGFPSWTGTSLPAFAAMSKSV